MRRHLWVAPVLACALAALAAPSASAAPRAPVPSDDVRPLACQPYLVDATGLLALDLVSGHTEPITAAKARRLACDADILPVVMNGNSVPLDVGRERRLFTNELRQLLILRDRGCTFPGCSAPAAWCDAHHVRHWVDGGPTDLSNATLLCGRHHTIVHRDQLTATIDAGGVNWHTAPEPARWPDTVTGAPGPTRHRNRHRR